MRMHRRLGVLAIAAAGAVRLAACGGSSGDAIPAQGFDGSFPHDGAGGGGDDDGSGPGSEGGGDTSLPPPPSYCQGIVFYASFDPSLDPEIGATKARPTGAVATATGTGRYGNALALVDDASVDGSAVFYETIDGGGGAPFYSATEGTVAFWFANDPAQPLAPDFAYLRAVTSATALVAAGPVVARGPGNSFGEYADLGGLPLATLVPSAAAPFLRVGDYNQWVAEWHVGDDAGAGGVALFAINGGTGEVVSDASFDAQSVDGATDDAGNFTTPYAARRSVTLRPYTQPFGALRVGGNQITTPQGRMDDLAIWNRMLDRAEIAALYASPTSVHERCRLP